MALSSDVVEYLNQFPAIQDYLGYLHSPQQLLFRGVQEVTPEFTVMSPRDDRRPRTSSVRVNTLFNLQLYYLYGKNHPEIDQVRKKGLFATNSLGACGYYSYPTGSMSGPRAENIFALFPPNNKLMIVSMAGDSLMTMGVWADRIDEALFRAFPEGDNYTEAMHLLQLLDTISATDFWHKLDHPLIQKAREVLMDLFDATIQDFEYDFLVTYRIEELMNALNNRSRCEVLLTGNCPAITISKLIEVQKIRGKFYPEDDAGHHKGQLAQLVKNLQKTF